MPVAYEGYWAKAIESAIELVAGSSTFATLVSPTTPKNLIVELDGGIEAETTPTITACNGASITRATAALWAHVGNDQPEWQNIWQTPQGITAEGMIPVAFYWRTTGITLRHEQLRYVLAKTGLIAADIQNQQGQTGKWRKIVCQLAAIHLLDQAGYARGTLRSQINIQYGDLP